jgi:hypothetical protein
MTKRGKVLAYLAAFLGGSMVWNGGCWGDGLGGFWSGWFRRGFIDNPYWDAVTDWLNEDLLG